MFCTRESKTQISTANKWILMPFKISLFKIKSAELFSMYLWQKTIKVYQLIVFLVNNSILFYSSRIRWQMAVYGGPYIMVDPVEFLSHKVLYSISDIKSFMKISHGSISLKYLRIFFRTLSFYFWHNNPELQVKYTKCFKSWAWELKLLFLLHIKNHSLGRSSPFINYYIFSCPFLLSIC